MESPAPNTFALCGVDRHIKHQREKERLYGAILASPAVVLEYHGLLAGHQATCHPGFVDQLTTTDWIDDRVVMDGICLTSRGPGTAVEFALALVERLYGKAKRDEVAAPMVI